MAVSDPPKAGPAPSAPQTFFPDPAVDRLTSTVLRLAEELWVLTERMAAFEALAARRGVMPAEDLAAFQFTPDEDEAVRADRGRFIRRILDPLAPDGAPPKAKPGPG
jgi:hypothetical protein